MFKKISTRLLSVSIIKGVPGKNQNTNYEQELTHKIIEMSNAFAGFVIDKDRECLIFFP